MAKLGIKDLISEFFDFIIYIYNLCLVTNAAGSLNPDLPVGTSM